MIISHEHKFIFVKTRKTAGTSIEVALEPFLSERDIVTPIANDSHPARNFTKPIRRYRSVLGGSHVWEMKRDVARERWFFNHIPGRLIRARIGPRTWNSYFKFCFERDPWEKTISWYYYRFAQEPDAPSFDEYVANGQLPSDFDRYSLDGSTVAVDFVGRYENLVDDLRVALDHVGIDHPVQLPNEKGAFRPGDSATVDLFDAAKSARVEAVYRREIATFGYTAPALR